MSVVKSLTEFAVTEGYTAKVTPDGRSAKIRYALEWDEGNLLCEVSADDDYENLTLRVKYPVAVPVVSFGNLARLLNRINNKLSYGSFSFNDFEPMMAVEFNSAIDLEGATITCDHIRRFMSGMYFILETYYGVICEICKKNADLESVWYDFVALLHDQRNNPDYYSAENENG